MYGGVSVSSPFPLLFSLTNIQDEFVSQSIVQDAKCVNNEHICIYEMNIDQTSKRNLFPILLAISPVKSFISQKIQRNI